MTAAGTYTDNLGLMDRFGINAVDMHGHDIEDLITEWVKNKAFNYLTFTDLTTGNQVIGRVTYIYPAVGAAKTFDFVSMHKGTGGASFTDQGLVAIEYFPQSPVVYGDQTIQNTGSSNYLTLEHIGACGPSITPSIAWADNGNEQGRISITDDRQM